MASLADIEKVSTAVFHLRDGHRLEVSNNVPRLDYAFGSRAYTLASNPYPLIRVYEVLNNQ